MGEDKKYTQLNQTKKLFSVQFKEEACNEQYSACYAQDNEVLVLYCLAAGFQAAECLALGCRGMAMVLMVHSDQCFAHHLR